MAGKRGQIQPKTFFLNELHELGSAEKPRGGRVSQYEGISWAAKGRRIKSSLEGVQERILASKDPLRDNRYFVLADPVPAVKKRSENKKKAPTGTFEEKTNFGGEHARVFGRLGLDFIHVTEDGRAVVHAQRSRFAQLVERASLLQQLGSREQARWVTIDRFEIIPSDLRIDREWLASLPSGVLTFAVIELQPLLTTVEVETVMQAIADVVGRQKGQALMAHGKDFSGRHWLRGKLDRASLQTLAKDFFSVQALHPPLYSYAATHKERRDAEHLPAQRELPDPRSLPCVAVVDLGVPADHKQLARYRRGDNVAPGAAKAPVGDHGSLVASRVVFGDHETPDALTANGGACSFFDLMVGEHPFGTQRDRIDDKAVLEGCERVVAAAPDVRAFNMSFGDHRPLREFSGIERREKLILLRDLDNFVFARDVIVVVAAGNTTQGLRPGKPYPDHLDDPQWGLGPLACGFNTLICGAYVNRLSPKGLVRNLGWPSPFSRVGPGVCEAPVPGFGAPGGDSDETYNWSSGLGVWGLSAAGLTEDHCGTSHAAPILAREAAITLHRLQAHCPPRGYPFGVTAKAFLALTANPSNTDERVNELTRRTLGRGRASVERLTRPLGQSAVMLWQGVIGSSTEEVSVQIPIPKDWLRRAKSPQLRLAAACDVPVSEAASGRWACRKVALRLRPGPETRALRSRGVAHETYPVLDRVYDLRKVLEKGGIEGDFWIIELSYDEIADYPAGIDFDPSQRIAFALELFDADPNPVSPQAALQALPIAASMIRLSSPPVMVRSPVIIRAR